MNSTDTGIGIAAKSSPAVAVVLAEAAGMTLEDWVQTLTIVYLALMIVHHLAHTA